jgi:hypothetical protein
MAADKRRQQVVLAVLLGALSLVLASRFWPVISTPAIAPRPGRAAPPGAAAKRGAPTTPEVVDVQVGRLDVPAPDPGLTGRNPFRFRPKAPPPPPPPTGPGNAGAGADSGAVTDPSAPPPPPPPPPITLKFIGTVDGVRGGKVAVLSDGKYVYYGREGDIIEGRYRVVKIGEESVQMEYLDGRGRQTIRLSGA